MSHWSLLIRELDDWRSAGEVAAFWWRDDDAAKATPELEALLDYANSTPIALAVVPGSVDNSLAARLRRQPNVAVLQHGWRHINHSSNGFSEYPPGRDHNEVADEFRHGRSILRNLFGDLSLPVFAPPWHGFEESYFSLLSQCGISAISRKGARSCGYCSGLQQVNIHCAPIRWTNPPGYGTDEEYLDTLLDHLKGRRLGIYDKGEPTGVLTHHLVQNSRSYEFLSQFAGIVREHRSALWVSANDVFRH